jgi:hypothetical protein
MFYAKRVWDERAERGYMKEVEDNFQILADRIVLGLSDVDRAASQTISRFLALWSLRHHFSLSPSPDHVLWGVTHESLPKGQQETLEKRWAAFLLPGNRMPGRMISGLLIQTRIDEIVRQLESHCWGVLRALGGEFLVPDTFGPSAIVPVSPTVCLACGLESQTLSDADVPRINRLARLSANRYLFARDLDQCP